MGLSCISCPKPPHANYLQYQRYACQAPIALHASTPQARATFRSWAPRSLMTLRASAPWTSRAFHAPRSAPQAPPHSSRACVFRLGAGRVPAESARHHGVRPAEPRPGLFHAGLIHIPRVRFHIGHVGDGEDRHGKARVLACIMVLSGKREKRSDRPAQIRLFTTQVI